MDNKQQFDYMRGKNGIWHIISWSKAPVVACFCGGVAQAGAVDICLGADAEGRVYKVCRRCKHYAQLVQQVMNNPEQTGIVMLPTVSLK